MLERLLPGIAAVIVAALAIALVHGRLPRSRRLTVLDRVRGGGEW